MSEWISVKDRLPSHDSLVVAAHISEFETATTDIEAAVCWVLNEVFYVHTSGIEASNYDGGATIELDMEITHWMPLPEPPEGN